MPVTAPSGMTADYSIDVARNGKIYYREVTLKCPEMPPPPPEPRCASDDCLDEYLLHLDIWCNQCAAIAEYYNLLGLYHHLRCDYCMQHKGEDIDQKYILGEPVPLTRKEVKQEIDILKKLLR